MTAATEESMTPPDSILSRFPDRSEEIKEFYKNSATYREICDDYDEMVKWLENNCESEKQSSRNCEYAMELLRDLETEINDCFERANKLVNDECIRSARK